MTSISIVFRISPGLKVTVPDAAWTSASAVVPVVPLPVLKSTVVTTSETRSSVTVNVNVVIPESPSRAIASLI